MRDRAYGVGWLRAGGQAGMALITTMMVMMLVSVLMVGFVAAIVSDNRGSGLDRDQTQAYAAAHAGLEKLTSDLSALFTTDFSPSATQINTVKAAAPVVPGFSYIAPGSSTAGSGYAITFTPDASGNPKPADPLGTTISAGPYQGFKGIITPYDLTVTARSSGGAEVRMRRTLQTIAVPVFQFGVFSDSDLTFYGGDDFDFGGRAHTNGNMYLAELTGQTLSMSDRVTAAGEVIRNQLANSLTVAGSIWTGSVSVITSTNVYRNLAVTEGSKVTGPSSANNEPTWTNLSVGTYNGNIKNGKTGAKKLDLPLVTAGATPLDLIRRPLAGESTTGLLFPQRYFGHADVSLRILLSDTAADITSLPTVTATAPVSLDGNWIAAPPTGYGPVDATHPPVAASPGPSPTSGSPTGTTTANSSTYSGGVVTVMNVSNSAGIPNYYKIPATLTVTSLPILGITTTRTATCTGRTLTTFTGCSWTGGNFAFPLGATVSGTVPAGWYPTARPATATAAAIGSGSATITISSSAGTADFAPGFMFVDDNPVTCTGYNAAASPPAFLSCTQTPAFTGAPASGLIVTNGAAMPAGTGTVDGFIKVEQKWQDGSWHDVTVEFLNLGMGAPNQIGEPCGDPTPNAVLRLQRLRDNGLPSSASSCGYAGSTNPTDWWPQTLYDPREGNLRDNLPTNTQLALGGVMHYVALDVGNLKKWLAGTTGTTGTQTYTNNGYVLYFSDRRANRNAANVETGEYGYEDIVNPTVANGTPNNTLDVGEDFNGNGTLETYGATPVFNGSHTNPGTFLTAPLVWTTMTPRTPITPAQARVNGTLFFRRALKLINGGLGSLPATGLTVATENPVYVQGNYNATTTSVSGASAPAAVIGDSITILSSNWKDTVSFDFPNDIANRPAVETGYRFAVVTGKGLSFTWPSWSTASGAYAGSIFGTDGGVGNFLRYMENWNVSGRTIHYKGSLVSLYTSRQSTGTFKCCVNVYSYGERDYSFDTNFLTPSLLPPGTPMFRDVNTLTFRQMLRPTQ